LCHGISGNALLLHSLYRATKDEKWLKRALQFGALCADKEIQAICKSIWDPQRKIEGMSDHPFSLMEGTGGDICAMIDLITPRD